MEGEPYVDESEWTRIWEHTFDRHDRRRVSDALKREAVCSDPTDALMAAELARRGRTVSGPPRAAVWFVAAVALVYAGVLAVRWPDVEVGVLVPAAMFSVQALVLGIARRSHGRSEMLDVERRNLEQARRLGRW
jgi:predicted anti-sigma-YlaC factor YlaD